MMTLDGGRIGIAAQALGIAEGALDVTVEYVKQRVQFGRPIAKFQNTQFELAKMKANTEAAKMLVYPLPTLHADACSCSAATATHVSIPSSA